MTVTLCWPTSRLDVVIEALPPAKDALPIVLPAALNTTLPTGVPELDEATDAVKVTAWPNTLAFGEEVAVVVVGPAPTRCDSDEAFEPTKLLSPL